MSYLYEMERGTKWDCENFLAFGSKAIESPRKLQLADWNFVDDGEIDTGSFNLSGVGVNTSSVKSSISASTDSSTRNQIRTPNIGYVTFEDSSGKVSKNLDKMQTYAGETCQPLEPSFGSVEPLIGLKLGKRTYFENRGTAGYVKDSSLSVMSSPSAITQKRKKPFARNAPTPFCQVEGCNMDLSTAKDYHRKHRVCDIHSKCPKVIVGGLERRFCQQCSRFHGLFYFDGKKRSCRNKLSDHNARRRKPRPKDIHFDSSSLSSPLFGGTQQLSSLLDNSPFINSMRTPTNSMWDSTWSSKFSLTKEIKLPHLMNMHDNAATGFFASKSSTPEVLSPGGKGGSLMSSYSDVAAPEYDRRALSLLSNSSWGSCGPQTVPLHHHPMHENYTSTTHQYPMIPEFWPTQCPNLHGQSLAASSNFQLFKTPRESDFYSNLLN